MTDHATKSFFLQPPRKDSDAMVLSNTMLSNAWIQKLELNYIRTQQP